MPSAEATLALPARTDDRQRAASLRRGDEEAFGQLIDRYQPALLSVATRYVGSRAVAKEVVQDTWVGLLRGIDEFEGRSSLKTWLFRILVNTAMLGSVGAAVYPVRIARRGIRRRRQAVDLSASSTAPITTGTAAGRQRPPTGDGARGAAPVLGDARLRKRGDRDTATAPARRDRAP